MVPRDTGQPDVCSSNCGSPPNTSPPANIVGNVISGGAVKGNHQPSKVMTQRRATINGGCSKYRGPDCTVPASLQSSPIQETHPERLVCSCLSGCDNRKPGAATVDALSGVRPNED